MAENLQLVKIEHRRCSDWAGITYAWAPADWDEDLIQTKVWAAVDAHRKALKDFKEPTPPPNDYRPYSKPNYENYPTMTVAEVKRLHEAKQIDWEIWNNKRKPQQYKFGQFLTNEGFISFWQGSEGRSVLVEADWGHNHGLSIDYDETEIDPSKSPEHMATGEDPEEF